MSEKADAVVIGGGLYGCKIALALRAAGVKKVVLVERNADILREASRITQGRIHRGYHYPRSLETARAMNEVYTRFLIDHFYAVTPTKQIYAIASRGSRTSVEEFERFCHEVGLSLNVINTGLFAPRKVDCEFEVEETVIDSNMLALTLREQLQVAGVDVQLESPAVIGRVTPDRVSVITGRGATDASYVFDATYANIPNVSHPTTEITIGHCEVVLIPEPKMLKGKAVLVIDGPFWSVAPYPTDECWQVTHVSKMLHEDPECRNSHADEMLAAVDEYIPGLGRPEWHRSVYVDRALLDDPTTDSRPSLWEYSPKSQRIITVLGGKLSGIYDVTDMIRRREW